MNKTSLLFDGVRIIGATLWSEIDVKKAKIYEKSISDYYVISLKNSDSKDLRQLRVEDTNRMHADQLNFIKEEIQKAKQNGEPVIVFTHHAPSIRYGCSHPEDSPYINGFCTELSELFGPPVKAWCYGHTHWFKDFTVKGTRIITNPKGYVKETMNYDPSFVLSVQL